MEKQPKNCAASHLRYLARQNERRAAQRARQAARINEAQPVQGNQALATPADQATGQSTQVPVSETPAIQPGQGPADLRDGQIPMDSPGEESPMEAHHEQIGETSSFHEGNPVADSAGPAESTRLNSEQTFPLPTLQVQLSAAQQRLQSVHQAWGQSELRRIAQSNEQSTLPSYLQRPAPRPDFVERAERQERLEADIALATERSMVPTNDGLSVPEQPDDVSANNGRIAAGSKPRRKAQDHEQTVRKYRSPF